MFTLASALFSNPHLSPEMLNSMLEEQRRREEQQKEKRKNEEQKKKVAMQRDFFEKCRQNDVGAIQKILSKKLFRKRIDPNFKYAGQSPLSITAMLGHVQILILLVQSFADIDYTNDNGNTPFLEAVKHNQKASAILLASHLANATFVNFEGRTALHYASMLDSPNILEWLLPIYKGERINLQDMHGKTALHLAMEAGSETSVRLLLENGASAEIEDHSGMKPLDIAILNKANSKIGFNKYIILMNYIQGLSDRLMFMFRQFPVIKNTEPTFFTKYTSGLLLYGYSNTSLGQENINKIIQKSHFSQSIMKAATSTATKLKC